MFITYNWKKHSCNRKDEQVRLTVTQKQSHYSDIYVVHFQEGSYVHGNWFSINNLRESNTVPLQLFAAEVFWETPLLWEPFSIDLSSSFYSSTDSYNVLSLTLNPCGLLQSAQRAGL